MEQQPRKILIVTSTYRFMKSFLIPYIKELVDTGWIVHISSHADDNCTIPYAHKRLDMPVARTPFSMDNFKAIGILSRHIAAEKYDIINCHTPMGAYVGRVAARCAKARENGAKVIYMAHGFHFYTGAPLLSWMLYYSAEKIFAHYTDALITINKEDSLRAREKFSRIKQQYCLPGIGYNPQRIQVGTQQTPAEQRQAMGLHESDFVLLYIAGLIPRKNHKFILSCMPMLLQEIPQCKLLLLGQGEEEKNIRATIKKLGIEDAVLLCGFQENIAPYLQIADVALSSSIWEGLTVGLMEDMAAALPVVASEVKGQLDLMTDGETGYLYKLGDKQTFIDRISHLYHHPEARREMGKKASQEVKKYSVEQVLPQLMEIIEKESRD